MSNINVNKLVDQFGRGFLFASETGYIFYCFNNDKDYYRFKNDDIYKGDDEPDPDNVWEKMIYSRSEMFPNKPSIRIPQVEIEIRYLDRYDEIVKEWVRLEGNEQLRGIVPDQFIDTGHITIYG